MSGKIIYLIAAMSSLALGTTESSVAQNAVQLFGSTHVRVSTNGSSLSQPGTFNSATANLTCDASSGTPIRAVLSSTADGTGNVLIDNLVRVSVVAGSSTSSPANVCRGGNTEPGVSGTQNNCFSD